MKFADKLAAFKQQSARIWALSLPYFQSEEKWKARVLLAAIVLLNLGAVYMLVQINEWNRVFYDALEARNQKVFWAELWRFTYLAFAFIIIAVYRFYLTQLLEVRWRTWMTADYTRRWLANKAFYNLELMRFTNGNGATPDNPDQRIHEDINLFTSYTVGLTMGLLNAVVTLVSFVGILWGLSGGFSFTLGGTTYEIAGFMVWMAVVYALAGSVITHFIGRPLIALNFKQQRYEADFRHHLVRVREYSEAIALDKGEAVEQKALDTRFGSVLKNYLLLLSAQKRLTWFTVGFSQAAVVFPFIVAAPRFFSGAIQLGQLMQIASAFGRVQDALSWFVDNYSSLAAWKATTDRLTSFEASLFKLNRPIAGVEPAQPAIENIATEVTLHTQDLQLALPSGEHLAHQLQLHAEAGDAVLISGPSGSGKSTLLRAFAGIWPFGRGKVNTPPDAMFIPQRPYFPNGTLRAALAYPQDAALFNDAQLQTALDEALLPQLKNRLDEEDAWGQKLSGGEQQRLALARVFLKKPQWVFADEATSALDEAAEKTIYERLLAQVKQAQGALVSIAHRPAVAQFHTRRWAFEPAPAGEGARFAVKASVL